MTDFIKFLRKHCRDHIKEGSHILTEQWGENHAYGNVAGLIDTFLEEYEKERTVSKSAEQNFLASIELDVRRQFDDPAALIEHLHKIASRPPIFDSTRISLSAISAFCSDYITHHNKEVRDELLKQAPF